MSRASELNIAPGLTEAVVKGLPQIAFTVMRWNNYGYQRFFYSNALLISDRLAVVMILLASGNDLQIFPRFIKPRIGI
jgi:hypothetical protein